MNRAGALLALLVGCATCRPTTASTQKFSTTPNYAKTPTIIENRFQAKLDCTRDELGVPGATAAYALPDGTIGVASSGLADVESRTPMTSRTRMLAASIGKSFVAGDRSKYRHFVLQLNLPT